MDRAQDVRRAVEALKAEGVAQAEEYPRFHRPWGWYETLALGPRFQVKRIMVRPGGKLSLQSHTHRAEHWVVVAGTARITIGERIEELRPNESCYVPLGERHRLENPGAEELHLIEVQIGGYLGEDDITRYDDVYSRE
jgi:mannose-1-phosphate guanylyltransferase/mannose-1-phosphate guanylyltransferase/mannose-6-phosphate isomerase